MNIVQAYTKFKGQFIILISGFSGSGKTKISKFIAELFGFKHINLSQFYYPTEIFDKKDNYALLKDKTPILDWDNIYKSVDWDKFNTFINDNKQKGLVVVGFGFPTKLLHFDPNFHIHIKISKKNLLENREKYIETHATNKDISNDKDIDKSILNNITYPLYLKINEDSKIDKYINVNDVSEDDAKEETFTYLINMIQKWLDEYNKTKIKRDDKIDRSNKSRPLESNDEYCEQF